MKRKLIAILIAALPFSVCLSSCGDEPGDNGTDKEEVTNPDIDDNGEEGEGDDPDANEEPTPSKYRNMTEDDLHGLWQCIWNKQVMHMNQMGSWYVKSYVNTEEDLASAWGTWNRPRFQKSGAFIWNYSNENLNDIIETNRTNNPEGYYTTDWGRIENGIVYSNYIWKFYEDKQMLQIFYLSKNGAQKTLTKTWTISEFDGETFYASEPYTGNKNIPDGHSYYDYYYRFRLTEKDETIYK